MHPLSTILATVLLGATLTACDRPTTVNNPPTTVVVPTPTPGPAGPKGDAGKPGEPGGTAVVVVPAPAAASDPK